MSKSQLVGEGINNGHMHYYNETVTGHVEWCEKCKCFITGGDCQHENYIPCYERSMYIRLKAKYEAVEHGVQPTPESGRKMPAKKSNRKGSAPAKSG